MSDSRSFAYAQDDVVDVILRRNDCLRTWCFSKSESLLYPITNPIPTPTHTANDHRTLPPAPTRAYRHTFI